MSTLYSIESTVDSYEYPTRDLYEYLPGDSSEYTLDSIEYIHYLTFDSAKSKQILKMILVIHGK